MSNIVDKDKTALFYFGLSARQNTNIFPAYFKLAEFDITVRENLTGRVAMTIAPEVIAFGTPDELFRWLEDAHGELLNYCHVLEKEEEHGAHVGD